jgi:hypothetical protein
MFVTLVITPGALVSNLTSLFEIVTPTTGTARAAPALLKTNRTKNSELVQKKGRPAREASLINYPFDSLPAPPGENLRLRVPPLLINSQTAP